MLGNKVGTHSVLSASPEGRTDGRKEGNQLVATCNWKQRTVLPGKSLFLPPAWSCGHALILSVHWLALAVELYTIRDNFQSRFPWGTYNNSTSVITAEKFNGEFPHLLLEGLLRKVCMSLTFLHFLQTLQIIFIFNLHHQQNYLSSYLSLFYPLFTVRSAYYERQRGLWPYAFPVSVDLTQVILKYKYRTIQSTLGIYAISHSAYVEFTPPPWSKDIVAWSWPLTST